MLRLGRLFYWIVLALAALLAALALASAGFLRTHFPGANIRLFLEQFRRALLALPLLLVWLRVSRCPATTRCLHRLQRWWLTSRIPLLAAPVFFLAITILVADKGYHRIPLGDAVWVMFQAKLFAAGRLFAPAPQYPEFFWARLIIHDGKWFSYTSPGHSLVLLPGLLLGAAWLVGPLLGGLTVWLLHRLAQTLLGAKSARIALLLTVTSPFVIFLFASHEFHVSSVFFTTLALYLLSRERFTPGLGLATGLSLGMVFLARPYTAVAVGLPIIAYVLVKRRTALAPFLLGGALIVGLHLIYNHALTGSYLKFPYQEMGKVHAIGFGSDFGEPAPGFTGHSPLRATVNLGYQFAVMSLQFLGWLFLSMAFVIPGLAYARFRRLWWLWAPALALIVAYCFYWSNGITARGAKYWSETIPAFILASTVGIRAAGPVFRRWFAFRRDLALRAVPFLVVYSLAVYIPTNLSYLARCQWGETPKVGQDVAAHRIHNAVVFVHTDEHSGGYDYTSAFLYNDPLLQGDVIYARDLGPENVKLTALYPERKAYRYDFNRAVIEPLPGQP